MQAESPQNPDPIEEELDPVETETLDDEIEDPRPGLPAAVWSALILVAFALGLGAGYLVWGQQMEERVQAAERRAAAAEQAASAAQQQAAAGGQAAAGAQDPQEQEVRRYPVPEDDDYVFGSADAPITIIEFSDYECPFCQRWHVEVWPKILEKYGDQVRLIYRDFPLESIHPNATPAAEAANCAGEQGEYYPFNELLFTGGQALNEETYEAYATQLSLDLPAFQQCFAEGRYRQEVQDDINYAAGLGVRSTPTFFINGLAVVGAQPFEVFDQIIGMELAGEIPK